MKQFINKKNTMYAIISVYDLICKNYNCLCR